MLDAEISDKATKVAIQAFYPPGEEFIRVAFRHALKEKYSTIIRECDSNFGK